MSRTGGCTAFPVSKLIGNEEPALTAYLHANEACIPAGNDAMRSKGRGRREGCAMIVRRVELLAVRGKPACVVHGVVLHRRGGLASADLHIDVFESVGSVHDAVDRRDALRQRGGSCCMVRMRGGGCRSLSDSRGGCCCCGKSEDGQGCVEFHVFDSTAVARVFQARSAANRVESRTTDTYLTASNKAGEEKTKPHRRR